MLTKWKGVMINISQFTLLEDNLSDIAYLVAFINVDDSFWCVTHYQHNHHTRQKGSHGLISPKNIVGQVIHGVY